MLLLKLFNNPQPLQVLTDLDTHLLFLYWNHEIKFFYLPTSTIWNYNGTEQVVLMDQSLTFQLSHQLCDHMIAIWVFGKQLAIIMVEVPHGQAITICALPSFPQAKSTGKVNVTQISFPSLHALILGLYWASQDSSGLPHSPVAHTHPMALCTPYLDSCGFLLNDPHVLGLWWHPGLPGLWLLSNEIMFPFTASLFSGQQFGFQWPS